MLKQQNTLTAEIKEEGDNAYENVVYGKKSIWSRIIRMDGQPRY